ncbi:MAG TPA: NIPSNAP family protein [Bryobacteraceae bacterium]|nr:NIPSNAP family protein [Bryobacteraceae bacterium]
MRRRKFLPALAGVAAAGPLWPAPDRRTRFYVLETFQLRQGDQVARMNDCLKAWLPALSKDFAGPKLVLEAVIAPHTPQLLAVIGVATFEETRTALATLTAPLHSLGAGEPAFDILNTAVLEAAAYSPEIPAEKRDRPRYFELRTYHSPSGMQLDALHRRFAQTEVGVFHRSGIFPLFYSSTLIGANLPNLTYLIPFDSLAAREKAWDAFSADPEWIKARKESIDKYGQIVSVSDIAIYRATPYSPIS